MDERSSKAILEILKNEYGISTPSQLDEAVAKLKRLDLTPFVGVAIKTKEATKWKSEVANTRIASGACS